MFVKICGVTNVDDALLAAGLGADAIGLNFAVSRRHIDIDTGRSIMARLPPDVLAVGVFRNQTREDVVEIADALGLPAVQLHGHETPEDCRWVAARVPGMIRAFAMADPALTSGDDYGPHRLLVDSNQPGSGQVFDWSNLELVLGRRPFILAGGLNPDNVAEAITIARPWGVDAVSGIEASPGRHDPSKVRRFIANARQAAAAIGLPSVPSDDLMGSREADTDEYHEETTW